MYIFIYNYLIIDNLCVVHARLFWSVQCKYNIHFFTCTFAKKIHLQRVLQVCLLVFLVVICVYIYIYTHTSLYSSPLLSLAGYEFSLGCKLDHVKYQWHFCN